MLGYISSWELKWDDGPSWKEDEGSVNLENTCGGGI